MSAKIGVLAVQGSFMEHIKSLERVKKKDIFKCHAILVVEIRSADDVTEDLKGLIIPGGESTAMLKFLDTLFLAKIKSWVEDYKRPVWGSCAGMILLADKVRGGTYTDSVKSLCLDWSSQC